MARRRTAQGPCPPQTLRTVHPHAAGMAMGSRFHGVAGPPDRSAEPVRPYQSVPDDLHRMADGLVALGITTVAMASTGVDGIPPFERREARGLEVHRVHARQGKNVPGRQPDVHAAVWRQPLPQHGLLRGSCRPAHALATLRAYLRHRARLLAYAAAHMQRRHKALMQRHVQRHPVVSEITGATGRKRLRAIVAGHHDPATLASSRAVCWKASEETVRPALTGNDRHEHLCALRLALELSESSQAKVGECAREIEAVLASCAPEGAARQRPDMQHTGSLIPALGYRSAPAAWMRGLYGLDAQRRVWHGHAAMADGQTLHPTFKEVWSTVANFAPLPLPDTRHGQYLRPHKRCDDPPGCHGRAGWAHCPRRSGPASLA